LACIRTAFGFVMNTDEVMALEGLARHRGSGVDLAFATNPAASA
jgi:hypothetical protein